MSRRIRITVKRRKEVDVDKLVFALLRIIEAEQSQLAAQDQARTEEGGETSPEESPS